jgi:hemoglobin-like flavoprotein
MSPEQVQTVQDTWKAVVPIAGKAADLFYDKLFLMDPGLRPLFPEDLTEQKKKLMSMIGRVVTALRDPSGVVPAIQDLGRKHVGYGVKKEDYTTVGGALLWTLEQGLGSAWNAEVKDSWVAAYTLLSGVMIDAASSRA